MPWGRIVKALSGYYYVLPDNIEPSLASLVQCRARGLFRKKGETPLVGDRVQFELRENNEGIVTSIDKRKNALLRPPVANVDQIVLVFSFEEPQFSSLLLDRFLVHIEFANIPVIICFNKADIVNATHLEEEIAYYSKIGYSVLVTSAKEEIGVEEVRQLLVNKISVFAGQSGVGKSSLLNRLYFEKHLKTSEISPRLGRGRHTTRHVELLFLDGNSMVADTPGFSQLDFDNMEPEELSATFLEFRTYEEQCKFRGCYHDREPGCAVRIAMHNNEIKPSRYKHYLEFLFELREAKQRRY